MDKAGNPSVVRAFLSVDNSPPLPGILLEGGSEIQVQCHGTKRFLFLHWTPSVDKESNIESYRVAAFLSPDAAQAISSAETNSNSLHAYMAIQNADSPLSNSTLFLTFEATNAAGLTYSSRSGPFQLNCETTECTCNKDIVCLP